jgi:hypothetical protein
MPRSACSSPVLVGILNPAEGGWQVREAGPPHRDGGEQHPRPAHPAARPLTEALTDAQQAAEPPDDPRSRGEHFGCQK